MSALPSVLNSYVGLADALEQAGEMAKAIDVLALAMKHFPREALFQAATGKVYLHTFTAGGTPANVVRKAEYHLEKGLRMARDTQSPWRSAAVEAMGIVYLRKKNYRKAVETLRQASEAGQDGLSLRVALGDSLARSGLDNGREDALAQLDLALKIDRGCIEAWRYRGRILRELDRLPESVEAYTAVFEHDAANAPAYAGRAESYWQNGETDAALRDLEHALLLDPQYAIAYARRGAVLIALERHEEALQDFDKALELEPKFAGAIFNRGLLYLLTGRIKDALKGFNEAIRLNGEPRALLHLYCGEAHQQLNQTAAALADYSHALKCDPELFPAWVGRADCHFILDEYAQAAKDYEKASRLAPEDPWSLTQQAECLLLQNDPRKGLNFLRKNAPERPDNDFICWTFGRLYFALGNSKQALRWLNRAVKNGARMPGLIGTRGEVLQRLGRYKESLQDFESALAVWQTNDWLRYGQAISYRKLGMQKEAEESMKLAISQAQARSAKQTGQKSGYRFNLALYFVAVGNESAALEHYKRTMAGPPVPSIRHLREAHGDLEHLLSILPGSAKAKKVLAMLKARLLGNSVSRRNPR